MASSSAAITRAETKRRKQAAQVIADEAKAISGRFSKRIPASIKVVGTSKAIYVMAEGAIAPNAYPFETGHPHPLFGNRNYWYKQPKRPFLEEAAASAGDEAIKVYAQLCDDMVDAIL